MPVFADGGIHQVDLNSGTSTLTADTCARCHRAHTAKTGSLLVEAEPGLCLACHGTTGTGATTNVEDGVQFAVADRNSASAVAGALRSGGFVQAAIDSAHSKRIPYPYFDYLNSGTYTTTFSSKVGVLDTPQAVTSAHLDLDGSGGVVARNTAWGNGAIGSGIGAADVVMVCTSCHNPHGNGQYRILAKYPAVSGSSFVPDSSANTVTDAAPPTGDGAAAVRNYTVQMGRTLADVLAGTYVNDGASGTPSSTAGDYWRRFQPWNIVPSWNGGEVPIPDSGHQGDAPMFVPGDSANLVGFRSQINLWCASCHQRYSAGGSASSTYSGDEIFSYRHQTNTTECTQCHVGHGSNAAMGSLSGSVTYPGGAAPTSVTEGSVTTYLNSRLLKIDNRGTCQACHDPTNTIPYSPATIISH
jgi:predicted CXXCH cytochrome family protein